MIPRTSQPKPQLLVQEPRHRLPVRKFDMPAATVDVGESVCAPWKGFDYKGELFAGTVSAMHADGTFGIVFDDGDHDDRCPGTLVRRCNGAPMPRPQGERGCQCTAGQCTV